MSPRVIFNFLLTIIVCFFLLSCDKKIVDVISVVEFTDISIADTNDVSCFSFPSLQVGYAGLGSVLYKTSDGGRTWNSLSSIGAGMCGEVAFFNEQIGLCSKGGILYKTNDGGLTWSAKTANGAFLGISDNAAIIFNSTYLGPQTFYNISKSVDYGETFVPLTTCSYFYVDYGPIIQYRIKDDKLIYVFGDATFDDHLPTINLSTGECSSTYIKDNFDVEHDIRDCCYINGVLYQVGTRGGVDDLDDLEYGYDMYSIDGLGDKIVAVGDSTLMVNRILYTTKQWYYTIDTNGNSFRKGMRKVRFFDENTFFVSGKNGFLMRCNF